MGKVQTELPWNRLSPFPWSSCPRWCHEGQHGLGTARAAAEHEQRLCCSSTSAPGSRSAPRRGCPASTRQHRGGQRRSLVTTAGDVCHRQAASRNTSRASIPFLQGLRPGVGSCVCMSPWAGAHCPHRGWGTLWGLGDRTRASLAGERELLDLWGGGVAVIVRLMDPPVRPLPKKDPEKKERRLWGPGQQSRCVRLRFQLWSGSWKRQRTQERSRVTHQTQHPAGCSLPTADTACLCPCPHLLKGKSKSFLRANQHAEKEEQRLLLLHRFQTKSNHLMLASEATCPCHTCRQRGGFELWGGCSAGAAGSPRRDMGHNPCPWAQAAPKPGDAEMQRWGRHHAGPAPLRPLVPQWGQQPRLPAGRVDHPPRYNDAIPCPERWPGPSHAPTMAPFVLKVLASPGRGYQCKTLT